jgi:hypothetical protein
VTNRDENVPVGENLVERGWEIWYAAERSISSEEAVND